LENLISVSIEPAAGHSEQAKHQHVLRSCSNGSTLNFDGATSLGLEAACLRRSGGAVAALAE
jgi:hypothetical protein